MKILSAKQKIQNFMSVRSDNPDLLKAQYRAFTRQMPMMYFILLSSTWALATTHMQLAPFWLTVGIPALFTLGCTLRVAFWWKTRGIDPNPKMAHAALQRTNRLAVGIAMAFTLWSFSLVPYGDAYTQSHVAFYMAITVISCIFCLMYGSSAAFIVTLIVNVERRIHRLLSGVTATDIRRHCHQCSLGLRRHDVHPVDQLPQFRAYGRLPAAYGSAEQREPAARQYG